MDIAVHNKSPLAHGIGTKTFAGKNLVKPQTVRKGYSVNGAYMGVVPTKLANGRLLWPAVVVTQRGAISANDEAIASKDGV